VASASPRRLERVPPTGALGVIASASLGTFFDYYDIFIAASAAALVWPQVFFSGLGQGVAVGLSLGAFGVNFIVRPLGAAIFGNYGDRLGRKRILTWTLLLSAFGTLGIGLLPSSATVGLLAPILLYLFRLVYGLGLGGEWGGAISWVAEFSSASKRRGLWTGLVQLVAPLAGVVSSLSFVLVLLLPHTEFLAWGWRLLFIVGSGVAIVGYIIRTRMQESPMFQELVEKSEILKTPAVLSFRTYGTRIVSLIAGVLYLFVFFAFFSVPYTLSYMIASGLSAETSNSLFTVALAFGVLGCLGGSYLSDKVGRRKVIAASLIISAALMYPWIQLVGSGLGVETLLGLTVMTVALEFGNGAIGAFLAESFPSSLRYSASGMSYSVAGTIGGLTSGALLPVLIAVYGVKGAIVPGSILCLLVAVMSIAFLLVLKETKHLGLTSSADPYGPAKVEHGHRP
jgi:MFS transporter, MHS family, shikimate and dehydroshikimate transport protein